jgi:hypothetical protein
VEANEAGEAEGDASLDSIEEVNTDINTVLQAQLTSVQEQLAALRAQYDRLAETAEAEAARLMELHKYKQYARTLSWPQTSFSLRLLARRPPTQPVGPTPLWAVLRARVRWPF